MTIWKQQHVTPSQQPAYPSYCRIIRSSASNYVLFSPTFSVLAKRSVSLASCCTFPFGGQPALSPSRVFIGSACWCARCFKAAPRTTARGFAVKFYDILSNESSDIITWTRSGLAFQVVDYARFSEEILLKVCYFHSLFFCLRLVSSTKFLEPLARGLAHSLSAECQLTPEDSVSNTSCWI